MSAKSFPRWENLHGSPVVCLDATINFCFGPKFVVLIDAAGCKAVELGCSGHGNCDVNLERLRVVDIVGIVAVVFKNSSNAPFLPAGALLWVAHGH